MARRTGSYAPPRRRRVASSPPRSKSVRRRQHVSLRGRRREELSRQLRGMVRRGLFFLGACAIVAFFLFHSDSLIRRQLLRHTPVISVDAPKGLSALPVEMLLPAHRWMMWCPGVGVWTARRIVRHFSTVRRVHIESYFSENRVVLKLETRQPLVLWNTFGFDGEGILFPLNLDAHLALPQLTPAHGPPAPTLGPWLLALSRMPWLWATITDLKEDSQGHWTLLLRDGPVLIWGSSDDVVLPRAIALKKVLDAASAEHGGAVRADLRFFSEGRIIVGVRRTIH